MCGICGFTGYKENRTTILQNMMSAIRHRGPDEDGFFESDGISLGFCRLSIIDLEKGNQPLHNESGRMSMVFNGEIYNHQELRNSLEKKGHIFSTASDSEIVLHGYEEYNLAIFDMLRGMFAFALWDSEEKRLFAARDFFGIKPFYYAVIGECFVFASEIKSILQFPGCPKKVNERALEQYLSFQYSVLDETFFEGIYRLPPGCCLFYENHHLEIKKYFKPDLSPEDIDGEKWLVEKMEQVLQASMERHMVSDVEIGAFLSGGVDSGFLAAGLPGRKVFTVGFMGERGRYSEIERAKELSEALSLEHYTRIITKEEFWDAIPDVMYYMDEPSGDAAAIALYFVAEEAAKHVKVVWSGEGADELFGGYNIYLEPEALKWMAWIPAKLRKGISHIAKFFPDIKGRDYLIRAGIPVEERYIGNAHIFNTQERRQVLRKATDALSTKQLLWNQYQQLLHLKSMSKMQQIDICNWLPGDILQKADRMSMAHSLELRVPYLDYDVYELAKKLPETVKIKKRQTKYLFRKVAGLRLPPGTANMKKLGFPVPIRLWICEEPWQSEIREAFTGEAAMRFFHEKKLLDLLDQHMNGKQDNSRKIWTIYMFLVWYCVFFEEGSRKEKNLFKAAQHL